MPSVSRSLHGLLDRTSRAALVLVLLTLLLPLGSGCDRSSKPAGGGTSSARPDDFAQAMNLVKNYYDQGEAAKAIAPFASATELRPSSAEAQLNLANAYLLDGQVTNALVHAEAATSSSSRRAMGSRRGRSESGRRGLRGWGSGLVIRPRRWRNWAQVCL